MADLGFIIAFWAGPIGWATIGTLYLITEDIGTSIKDEPIVIIPLLLFLGTIYGSLRNQRILFLASFGTALMAGYGFSTTLKELNDYLESVLGG